jgi:glyoxylase-like metal-dependent hydrolase (beta-lactamase superfamily II)
MTLEIAKGVFMVGGPELSNDRDACIYLVDGTDEAVLIDAGAGGGFDRVMSNIRAAGLEVSRVKHLILTHCHVDHSGGVPRYQAMVGVKVISHARCAEILAKGHDPRTAAEMYGMRLRRSESI